MKMASDLCNCFLPHFRKPPISSPFLCCWLSVNVALLSSDPHPMPRPQIHLLGCGLGAVRMAGRHGQEPWQLKRSPSAIHYRSATTGQSVMPVGPFATAVEHTCRLPDPSDTAHSPSYAFPERSHWPELLPPPPRCSRMMRYLRPPLLHRGCR